MPIASVCLYCASSAHCDPDFFRRTEELVRGLVERDLGIVYGAGSTGLMGEVARVALEVRGRVVGVIPEFMKTREWDHPELEEVFVVETMHERKQMMIDLADAFIALPGGTGTLEELTEVLSFKRLRLVREPVWIANWKQYYRPFLEQLDRIYDGRFVEEEHRGDYEAFEEVGDLLDRLTETFGSRAE